MAQQPGQSTESVNIRNEGKASGGSHVIWAPACLVCGSRVFIIRYDV